MISSVYIGNCKDELMKRISNIINIEKQIRNDMIDINNNNNNNDNNDNDNNDNDNNDDN